METVMNKVIGNHFEAELCSRLSDNGFWVHNLAQNKAGQPADIIAVKYNRAALIDCKVCLNNRFPVSRMEPNQEMAMTLWEQRHNDEAWFAFMLANRDIYMVSFDYLYNFLRVIGKTVMNEEMIRQCPTLEEWMADFNENNHW